LNRYDLAHVMPEARIEDPTETHVQTGTMPPPSARALPAHEPATHGSSANALDAHLDEMMGDAPVCDGCGHITVRNGACYKCLNCGNSMGCS
jgi:ribonucleoside-diphosphate reductase alpha chain